MLPQGLPKPISSLGRSHRTSGIPTLGFLQVKKKTTFFPYDFHLQEKVTNPCLTGTSRAGNTLTPPTWSSSHGAPATPHCPSQIPLKNPPKSRFLGMRVMGEVAMGQASAAVTRGHGDTGTGHVLGPCLLVGIKPNPSQIPQNLGITRDQGLEGSCQCSPPGIPGFPWLNLPELSQDSSA